MEGESFIPKDSSLHAALVAAAEGTRCIVFAGLPGIGKSLLTRQTGLIARGMGRAVTLMQWDPVRAAFEQHPVGRGFPDTAGVAHPAIRVAADDWVRAGVARWLANGGPSALLIVEAPLIGGRMMSLARHAEDGVEAFLAAETVFVLPVPTLEVKQTLRGRRSDDAARDASRPFASVDVLDRLVAEINGIAAGIGAVVTPPADYHPEAYSAVYQHAMRRRRSRIVSIDQVFEIRDGMPAGSDPPAVLPTDEEMVVAFEAAARLPADAVEERLRRWYD